jgi:cytochrome c oxidase cbb3-type subunit 1
MYVVRTLGGVMYLTGAGIMCFNLWQTAWGKPSSERSTAPSTVAAE